MRGKLFKHSVTGVEVEGWMKTSIFMAKGVHNPNVSMMSRMKDLIICALTEGCCLTLKFTGSSSMNGFSYVAWLQPVGFCYGACLQQHIASL